MLRTILIITATMLFSTNAWAAACNNAGFKNYFKGVKHTNAGTADYQRLDKKPSNYNAFNTHCYNNPTTGGCLDYFGQRYKIVATSAPTTKWSAAVCVKAIHHDNHYNYDHKINLQGQSPFYAGPKIRFEYKDDNGVWRILKETGSGNLASFHANQPNAKQKYRWKWFSDKPRQFRIVIERAMKFDEFDLLMDW